MLLVFKTNAQYFNFSEEPDVFVNDVVAGISRIDTESAQKVAYDFRNIWTSKISNEQKKIIISTAKKMQAERLQTRPYFQYYFSLITYAVTQANLDSERLTNVLKITETAVETYGHRKLDEYLRRMSMFFARSALYTSRFNSLKFSGGSYSFEILGAPKSFLDQIEEQDTNVPLDEQITEEEISIQEEDSNTQEDSWGDDDGWGNDDGWGDDQEDSWGNDDGWGTEETYEEEVPERPAFHRPNVDVIKTDKVSDYQADDITPPLSGAIIKLKNVDLLMTTPYDTVEIKNTSGSYMINDLMFVGQGGVFDWPNSLKGTEGAEVILKEYHFKTSVPYLKTTKAKMRFPRLFSDSLDGAFIFRSHRRKDNKNRTYPKFISNYSKTELKLPIENFTYKGGFSLVGDKMYGTSISEHPSVINVKDGKGRSFRTEAVKYSFEDSVIRSKRAYQVIFHGSDSIVHPGVQFSFDTSIPKLTLLKDEGDFKNTYYFSSYFKMDFKADLIQWDLNADSLDISIMNGRNIIPAVFESEEYFNPIRYDKLTGLFGFHPIVAVVQYARKINDSNFNVAELIVHYNKVDEKLIRAAMIYLQQNQYIGYDEITGDIHVLRKSYHNILSYSKKKDYDNILISSLSPDKPNASLNFETSEMTVRGVRRIFLTPDNKNVVTPKDEELTLLKNKDMRFDGTVVSGGFKYIGKEFDFDYNAFLINMAQVDSIRIEVEVHDSLKTADHHEKVALHNQITETSGILYVNHPKNKAGLREHKKYPYFTSDSDAVVYFDSPEILGGAYDRTVKFIIPPFEVDSLARPDMIGVGFEGTFIAGDILPEFKEKLVVMPDKSLGFSHKIPDEGYSLYGGEGVVYNDLKLNYEGLRVNGKIDYRTTTVNSNDFIFYMDSVSAVGNEGVIREGNYKGASYPEAVLGPYSMKWLPRKDSMYIANIGEPFQFYNATASLDGKANISAKGVFGSGVMLSRGSRSESNEFEFKQYEYSAQHAKFEILTDVPDKPAMAGDDISLHFDLVKNVADVHPEQEGVAAISFPYAQMKTSITNAIWDLNTSQITMTKPADVDISSSYFYTTREELDSLAFNATNAIYDINTYKLNIKGIPYIKVADAEIIPDNNETTILENSELQQFENASLKIDTLNEFHHLTEGNIKIISRNKFEGNAMYELVTAASDTFNIKFESFDLMDIPTGKTTSKKEVTKKMTVSGGTVLEEEKVQIAPGVLFKGDATMYADRKALELSGLVKLDLESVDDYNYWIQYYNSGDSTELKLDVGSALTEDATPIDVGLLYDNLNYKVYSLFVNNKNRPEDEYIFKADGLLTHDFENHTYKIEPELKSSGESYAGKTFIYNDKNKNVIFEGALTFTKNDENFSLEASGLGVGKPDSAQYFIDAFLMLNMNVNPLIVEAFTKDVLDIIERLGADVAHDNSIELIYKLSDLVGDHVAKNYEDKSLRDYVPMVSISPVLQKTIVLSNVDLKWNDEHKAWYNSSKIGLSGIRGVDINALMSGFLEIRKNDLGGDVVNLFLQVAETTWYHFSFDDNRLFLYSSNELFNDEVVKTSNIAKAGFGQFVIGLGEESETMKFINEFRKNYYNLDDPYNLEFPQDVILENNESFETIEKVEEKEKKSEYTEEEEEDDGF
ncbi:hypothetical protein [Reichenbachiella sp. MALMAid0571]|uniref:hypothetical protein n=1 Tax=Reichenbachiella sp. MALMAid0571 TaxID=3143939 RepID=UPI0032DE5509